MVRLLNTHLRAGLVQGFWYIGSPIQNPLRKNCEIGIFFLCVTFEETDQRLNGLPKVTELGNGRVNIGKYWNSSVADSVPYPVKNMLSSHCKWRRSSWLCGLKRATKPRGDGQKVWTKRRRWACREALAAQQPHTSSSKTTSCFLAEPSVVRVGRALQGGWKHFPGPSTFPYLVSSDLHEYNNLTNLPAPILAPPPILSSHCIWKSFSENKSDLVAPEC